MAADDRSLWTAKLFPSMVDPAPVRRNTNDDNDGSNNSNNDEEDTSPSCVLWLQNISRLATLSPSDPLYISTMTSITQWRGLAPYDPSIVSPGSPISDSHSHVQSYRYSLADLILLGDATAMALWRSYLQQAILIMYPSSMTTTTTTTTSTTATSTMSTTGSTLHVVYNSAYHSCIAATYRRLIRYAHDTATSRQVDVFTAFSDLPSQWCTEYFLLTVPAPVSTPTFNDTNKDDSDAGADDDGKGEGESYCLLDSFLPPSWRDNLKLRRYDTRHLPISKQKIIMSRIPMLILCLSRHFIPQLEEKRLIHTLLSWIPPSHPTFSLSESTPPALSTQRSVAEETVPRLLLFLNWLAEYTPLYVDPTVDLTYALTGDVTTSDNQTLLSDYFEAKAKVCVIYMLYRTLSLIITYYCYICSLHTIGMYIKTYRREHSLLLDLCQPVIITVCVHRLKRVCDCFARSR